MGKNGKLLETSASLLVTRALLLGTIMFAIRLEMVGAHR